MSAFSGNYGGGGAYFYCISNTGYALAYYY